MADNQTYCTDPVKVEVDGEKYFIQFKLPQFHLPGFGLVKSQQLVEDHKVLSAVLAELKKAKDPNGAEIASTMARMPLLKMVDEYASTDAKSAAFDFVKGTAKEQARSIETITREASAGKKATKELTEKVSALTAELETAQAEITDLKEQLAEANGTLGRQATALEQAEAQITHLSTGKKK